MNELTDILEGIQNTSSNKERTIVDELLKPGVLKERTLSPVQYHDNLMNGDVIIGYKFPSFLKKYWFSREISQITKSSATHSAFYLDGKMAHARKKHDAVVLEDISDRKEEIFLVLRPTISTKERADLEKRIRFYLDQPKEKRSYDYVGTVKYFLFKKFGLFNSYTKEKQKFFCSEFVAQCFQDIGIDLTRYADSSFISPKDILESPIMQFLYVIDGVYNGKKSKRTRDKPYYIMKQLKSIMGSFNTQ